MTMQPTKKSTKKSEIVPKNPALPERAVKAKVVPPPPPQKAPGAVIAPATPPQAATNRSLWRYIVLASSVVLFGVTAYLAHKHTLTGWELDVFRGVNDWPDSLRPYFLIATVAPESLWIGVAAVVVTFLFKLYRLTWQLAAAILGGFALAEVGKKLIGRARPAELIHNMHLRASDSGNGYPSGHTMIVTVILLTIWPYLPRGWRWLALLLIPIVGLSRIYLGLHAPLDIVGGVAVGAIVVFSMRLLPSIMRKFFRLD